jgi:hypothetical protein
MPKLNINTDQVFYQQYSTQHGGWESNTPLEEKTRIKYCPIMSSPF